VEELQNLPDLSITSSFSGGSVHLVNGSIENIRGDFGVFQEVYNGNPKQNSKDLVSNGYWTLKFSKPVLVDTLAFHVKTYADPFDSYCDFYLKCLYKNQNIYAESQTSLKNPDLSYSRKLNLIVIDTITINLISQVTGFIMVYSEYCYARLGEIRIIGKQIYQDKIRFSDKNGTVWVPFVDSESNSILRIFDGKVIQKIMLGNEDDMNLTPFRVQNGQYIMGTKL
jgi:hypothetical protein